MGDRFLYKEVMSQHWLDTMMSVTVRRVIDIAESLPSTTVDGVRLIDPELLAKKLMPRRRDERQLRLF